MHKIDRYGIVQKGTLIYKSKDGSFLLSWYFEVEPKSKKKPSQNFILNNYKNEVQEMMSAYVLYHNGISQGIILNELTSRKTKILYFEDGRFIGSFVQLPNGDITVISVESVTYVKSYLDTDWQIQL